jgi:hypothetical protein
MPCRIMSSPPSQYFDKFFSVALELGSVSEVNPWHVNQQRDTMWLMKRGDEVCSAVRWSRGETRKTFQLPRV